MCFIALEINCSRVASPILPPQVDNTFHICLSGYTNGVAKVFPCDPISVSASGPQLIEISNNSCKDIVVPDGTILIAYYCIDDAAISFTTRYNTAVVRAGGDWQLNFHN